jgi:hypothetical protein
VKNALVYPENYENGKPTTAVLDDLSGDRRWIDVLKETLGSIPRQIGPPRSIRNGRTMENLGLGTAKDKV